ncbi:thioesterase domain-containing protein [Streptomyces sp. NPDC052107]|uniref:thioesterase domain-containing protein n=1 Tax=Streptomyces sp. NPDC052107 TaxID=3155632 RepID=UPI003440F63E
MQQDNPEVTAVDRLREIWQELLEVNVEPTDDFFDSGGDSLLVVELVTRARRAGLTLRASDVFAYPTLQELALVAGAGRPDASAPVQAPQTPAVTLLSRAALSSEQVWQTYLSPWDDRAPSCHVPIIEEGVGDPLFVVHHGAGNVRYIERFAKDWGAGRPIHGFEAVGYRGEVRPLMSISEMAERYVAELVQVQPHGPYRLAGMCLGGVVAVEMARRLEERGEKVSLVALINVSPMDPFIDRGWGTDEIFEYRLTALPEKVGLRPDDDLQAFRNAMLAWEWIEEEMTSADVHRLQMLWSSMAFAQLHHEIRPYGGRVVVFQNEDMADAVTRNWLPKLSDVETHWIKDEGGRLSNVVRDPVIPLVMEKELGRVC